jgi:peptidoglycan-associated lipoprotein
VQIEAHCDERGTNNYNLALADRRALAVKKYMAGQGIAENRMHLISYGEEKPFCQESNEDCWKQNRKVHFNASGSELEVN